MFETGLLMLMAVLVPIWRLNGPFGHTYAKDNLFFALAGVSFAVLCFTGLPAPGPAGSLLLAFVGFYTLTCFWSDAPLAAMQELPRWWAGALVFLLMGVLPLPDLVLMALLVPAVAHVAYGLCAQFLVRDPIHPDIDKYLKEKRKALRFYGWLGNSNYYGAFFVPLFFVGLHLMLTHSWGWAVPWAAVLAGIIVTRCRAAWVSVMAGFAVFPDTWPFVILGGLALFLIGATRSLSIMTRYFYYPMAWRIWKKRPLCGWGPRVFRRKVFRVQAEMNQADPTLLGDASKNGRIPHPHAEWAHNEFLDLWMESGILGLGLFVAFVVLVGLQTPPEKIFLAAGLLAMLVNSLLFYNLRMASVSMCFWVLAGHLAASPAPAGPVLLPLWQAAPAAAAALYLVYHFAGKFTVAQVQSFRSFGEKDLDRQFSLALSATRWQPKNNSFLSNLAMLLQFRDPAAGMNAVDAMTQHFDGEKTEWDVWAQYGRMALLNRAFLVARSAFLTALYLNPAYGPARKSLAATDEALRSIGEELRRQETPENQPRIQAVSLKDVKRYGKAR